MKEALFFLAGLGLGVGGTYIVLKGSYDRQLEDEVAELMNYTRKPKKGRKKASKRVTEASEESEEESKKPEEIRDENDEFKPVKNPDIDPEDREGYSKIVKANYSKEDPGDIIKEKRKNKGKANTIFLLSPGAFAHSEKEQKTVILYKDGVVVNEEDPDEIIDNGYALLGGNDVIKEAEETEEGTVYIRNLNLDIDYEVIMADENYDGFSPDQGPEDE
jgi:hypothetical protein